MGDLGEAVVYHGRSGAVANLAAVPSYMMAVMCARDI